MVCTVCVGGWEERGRMTLTQMRAETDANSVNRNNISTLYRCESMHNENPGERIKPIIHIS